MTEKSHPSVGGAGQKASEMYDIKRDSAGNVVMESAPKNLSATTLNTSVTTTTTIDGGYIVSLSYTNFGGNANLTFLCEGSTVATTTGVANGGTGVLSTSFDSPVNALTARGSWTNTTVTSASATNNISTTHLSTTITDTAMLSIAGNTISASEKIVFNDTNATALFFINGSVVWTTGVTTTTTVSLTTTGDFVSPTITWGAHMTVGNTVTLATRQATLTTTTSADVTFNYNGIRTKQLA